MTYLEAEEVVDGGEAGVAGALAGRGAVDGDAEGGEGVERDGGLEVLHVVAAEHEHFLRRHP